MRTSSEQHASPLVTSNAPEAGAFAQRLIADAESGALRGPCGEMNDLAGLGQTAVPSLAPSRVN
jgi:hypothetical protein